MAAQVIPGFPRQARTAPLENKRSPTAVDRTVGRQIRLLRRTSGLTLKTLGKALGISSVQLQRYEMGTSRVAASRLQAIADALGVGVEALLGEPQPLITGGPPRRQTSEAIELVRMFNVITDPTHRLAIMALIRAVATPAPANRDPVVGPFAPIMPIGLNGTIPAAKE